MDKKFEEHRTLIRKTKEIAKVRVKTLKLLGIISNRIEFAKKKNISLHSHVERIQIECECLESNLKTAKDLYLHYLKCTELDVVSNVHNMVNLHDCENMYKKLNRKWRSYLKPYEVFTNFWKEELRLASPIYQNLKTKQTERLKLKLDCKMMEQRAKEVTRIIDQREEIREMIRRNRMFESKNICGTIRQLANKQRPKIAENNSANSCQEARTLIRQNRHVKLQEKLATNDSKKLCNEGLEILKKPFRPNVTSTNMNESEILGSNENQTLNATDRPAMFTPFSFGQCNSSESWSSNISTIAYLPMPTHRPSPSSAEQFDGETE